MADAAADPEPNLIQDAPSIFERPRQTDQLYESFPNSPQAYGMDPTDGMPKPVAPASVADAVAPPLHPDHFVCMEDTSAFVLRDQRFRDVVARFDPSEVKRMSDGTYVVPTKLAAERVDAKWRDESVLRALAQSPQHIIGNQPSNDETIVMLAIGMMSTDPNGRSRYRPATLEPHMLYIDDEWTSVEPLRRKCEHYARQVIDFPHEPDVQLMVRMCAVQRNDKGEFFDLGNCKLYACDMRRPHDERSADRIQAFDARVIEQGKQNEQDNAAFDVDAALSAEEPQ